jgi:hypothetical protein
MRSAKRLPAFAVFLFGSVALAQQSPPPASQPGDSGNPAATQQPNAQGQQPPPFTAPNPPTPDAAHAPDQKAVPQQQQPQTELNAPLPRPDKSTVDWREIAPQPPQPPQPPRPAELSTGVGQAEDNRTLPRTEAPLEYRTHFFNLIGMYHAPRVPDFSMASPFQLAGLIHDGKLYLSLHDAIVLAIENNLDVEVSRYNLLLAETDLKRAKGGGTLRGLDYTVTQVAPGVGSQTSPLLVTGTTTGGASPTSVNVTDLSQITQIGNSVQENLSENGTSIYSQGPNVPLFDPVVTADAAYLRRSDATSLDSTESGSSTGGSSASNGSPGALGFLSTGFDYQQGFSTGAQLDALTDNAAQALYGTNSQYNPFHSPSTSITLTQPLLHGGGRQVNRASFILRNSIARCRAWCLNSNCLKRCTGSHGCITTWSRWVKTWGSSRSRLMPHKSSVTTIRTRWTREHWRRST